VAVNGEILDAFVHGNLAYAESDRRDGEQVQVLFTPDYDLRGQTDIYLSYHSIYEQNQDNIASVEYSIDQGASWLPALYMLDGSDILRDGSGSIDVAATMNTARSDQPHRMAYGAFIGAPISQALAPFISARVNDDPVESKRVEFIRLAMADNQQNVRFRFMQAGAGSWYFGIDDFGIYSITTREMPLVLNQVETARLRPFGIDAWVFSAAAGQQLQFDLVNISRAGVQFSLTGPNGWRGFSSLTNDSAPVTLPSSGAYRLEAALVDFPCDYAFRMVDV